MLGLYRDPEGKNVFSSTMPATSDQISNSNRGIQKEEMLSSMQKKLEFSLQQPQVNTESNFLPGLLALYQCLNIYYKLNIFYIFSRKMKV